MSARGPRKAYLTDAQRRQVEQARVVATSEAEEIAGLGDLGPGNDAVMYATALGRTRGTVTTLLQIIDEITGGAR